MLSLITMFISSKWVFFNVISILLPYFCLQDINWILNKRRSQITKNLINAAGFNRVYMLYLFSAGRESHWGRGETKLTVKVKNDHRSTFSNLSNWKEEAWKNQGFNGIRTRDLRDTGAMLYQLSYEVTHWERGQFIEFISPVRSEMMWSILASLPMCGFIAQLVEHRTGIAEVTGSNPVEALIFSGFFFPIA